MTLQFETWIPDDLKDKVIMIWRRYEDASTIQDESEKWLSEDDANDWWKAGNAAGEDMLGRIISVFYELDMYGVIKHESDEIEGAEAHNSLVPKWRDEWNRRELRGIQRPDYNQYMQPFGDFTKGIRDAETSYQKVPKSKYKDGQFLRDLVVYAYEQWFMEHIWEIENDAAG